MNSLKFFLMIFLLLCCGLYAQEKFKLDEDFDTLQVKKDSVSVEKPEKLAIAVLELDANNVIESEAKALSDRLRIEIFNAGVYDVMERDKMNSILDEMQFQLSGCTTDECVVEIGRMIGVNKMIAGSVSKVGEFFTVTARIIDVETGKIESTATEDIQGTIGIVLTKAIPSVASQISGLGKMSHTSVLNISTEPEGAAIYLNELYKGISPLTLNVEPGYKYHLRAVKDKYEMWEKVYEPELDQDLNVAIVLSKKPVERVVIQKEAKKYRSFNQGFKVRYVHTELYKNINKHIQMVNDQLQKPNQLFKKDVGNISFATINSFNGIEIYNVRQVEDFMSFDFGLGFYRGDLGTWIKNLGDGDSDKDDIYSLVIWSPQLTLNLRLAPIRYILFYPYFNIGIGYNVFFMTAYENDESIGGPVYQSWGLVYGAGFEVKPFKFIGFSIELNRRNMHFELMDTGEVTDNFKQHGLGNINLTGNNLGLSLYLYF